MSEDEKDRAPSAKQEKPVKLQLKDYVALTIAAFETFLLPLVVLSVLLAVLAVIFTLRL